MGILKRIRNLWVLSAAVKPTEEGIDSGFFASRPHAEFILPDRVGEILSQRKNATIDDVIIKE